MNTATDEQRKLRRNFFFGLWYPLTMAVISILVLLFLLPETKGSEL